MIGKQCRGATPLSDGMNFWSELKLFMTCEIISGIKMGFLQEDFHNVDMEAVRKIPSKKRHKMQTMFLADYKMAVRLQSEW